MENTSLKSLIEEFKRELKTLTDWCKFNRLDINWDKTFIMFVTSKRIKVSDTIQIDD